MACMPYCVDALHTCGFVSCKSHLSTIWSGDEITYLWARIVRTPWMLTDMGWGQIPFMSITTHQTQLKMLWMPWCVYVGVCMPVALCVASHICQQFGPGMKLHAVQQETFEWENIANWWKIQFTQRNLSWIACFCCAKECHTPNFTEKIFTNSYKTVKFVKVFSLDSFPLYSTCIYEQEQCEILGCSLMWLEGKFLCH